MEDAAVLQRGFGGECPQGSDFTMPNLETLPVSRFKPNHKQLKIIAGSPAIKLHNKLLYPKIGMSLTRSPPLPKPNVPTLTSPTSLRQSKATHTINPSHPTIAIAEPLLP
ncbi:hypothetical protein NDA01_15380 [Trichocoleus desertorum AS-A10]|uniref:hypothetical protein n=1 Tax=Trichocoleus desertorum TaxID=1481672 RepID=UPI00329A016A